MHINPDHFLDTPEGRVITAERNAEAWRLAFAALEDALRARSPRSVVYVMVGCQGSGKSTWARARRRDEPEAIIFDAILVKRSERRPILEAAARYDVPVVAVVVDTPLDVCLVRNRQRPPDQIVPERNIGNVFAAVEPPDRDEGFIEMIVVPYAD
jgi:hypothetical protein